MIEIVGIVPARVAASRFPSKPLYPIRGRPLIEHCEAVLKADSPWGRH